VSLSHLLQLILLESGALISSDMKFIELIDLLVQILESNRKLQQRQKEMESSVIFEVLSVENITMKLISAVLKNCRNMSHLFSRLSVSFLKHLLIIIQKSSDLNYYEAVLMEVYEGIIQQAALQTEVLWAVLQEIIETLHVTEQNNGVFLPLLMISGHFIRNADYSKVLPVLVELLGVIRIGSMESKKLQKEIMKNVHWLFSDKAFFKSFCQTFAKTLANRSIRYNSLSSAVIASYSPSHRKRKRPRTSIRSGDFSNWYIDDDREDPFEKLSDWLANFVFPLTNGEKEHESIGLTIVICAFFPFRNLFLSVIRSEIHSITRILFAAIEKRILPQLDESPISSSLLDLFMCLFVHLDDWELKKYGHYFKEKVIYIDPVELCDRGDSVSKLNGFEWDWRSFAKVSLFLIEDKKTELEGREDIFQRVNSSTDFFHLYCGQKLFFKVIFFVNFLWIRASSLNLNNDSWSQSFPMQVALKAYVETDCEVVNCASISLSSFLAYILVKCEISSPQESARLLLDQLHNAWRNLTSVSSLNLRLAVLSSCGGMLCALASARNNMLSSCNAQSIIHHFPWQHFCICSKDKIPPIHQLSISDMDWLLDLHNLSLYPSDEYRVGLVSVLTSLFRHGNVDISDPLVSDYLWFLMEGLSSTIYSVRNVMSHHVGALVSACHANQRRFILIENENADRLKSIFSDAVKKAAASMETNFLQSVLSTFGSLACALNFQDENEADFILWIMCYLVGVWNKYWTCLSTHAPGFTPKIAVFSFDQVNRILSWHRVSWRYLCVEFPDQTYFPLINQLLTTDQSGSNGGLSLFLDVFVQNKVDVRTFLLASAPFVLPQYILHQNEKKLHMFVAKCNENVLCERQEISSKTLQLPELMLNHIEFILKEMIMHQVQVDDARDASHANRIAEWEFLFKFMPENSTIRDVMSHSPLRLLNLLAWELGGKRSRQAKRALKEISQYLQQESGGMNYVGSDVASGFMMPRQYFLALMTELGNRISSKTGSSSKSISYKVRATKSIHHLLLLLRSSSPQQDPAIGIGLVDAFVPKVMATLKIGLTERKLQRYAIQAWDTFVRMLSNKALESSFVSIVVSISPCLGYCAKQILQEVDNKVTSANLSWNIDVLSSRIGQHESYRDESDHEDMNAIESTASELLKYLFLDKRIELKHAFPRIQLLPSTPALDPIYAVLVQEVGDPLHKPLHSYLSDIGIYINHWDLGVREIALAQLFKCLVTRSSELSELMMQSGDEDLFVHRVIAELLFSLLQLARTESNPALKEICARCLGALGAIDPARIPLSMFYSSSTSTINRIDSRIEYSTKDLACTLVETWLVKELRAAPQNTDSVAFAIQELLRFLADLTADPQNAGQNASNDSPYCQSLENAAKQKMKPMPEWMKRRFERKDALQFVEPYWSTNYTVSNDSSKRKSVSSSNFSSASPSLSKDHGVLCDIDDDTTFYENYTSTYEEWLLSWTKRLIQISQLPERKIFLACRTALPTCPQIAVFLLPYLIQNVLRSGRPEVYAELKREIMAILNDHDHYVGMGLGESVIPVASATNLSESHSVGGGTKRDSGEELKERAYGEYLSRHHQCSQTIFSTLDQLNEWIWSDEKKKLALHSSSNKTSITPSGASIDMEDQEKENLEEFIKDIPTRSLSNAAYNIKAHARAIQYFEIFLRQQDYSASKSDQKNLKTSIAKEGTEEIMCGPVHLGLIAQNATYLQQLYSSVDETDALTGLATLRRVWEVSSMNARVANKRTSKRMAITQLMHRIVDHEQLAQWEDALACYEQAIQEVQSFHRSYIERSCDEPNANYEVQQDEGESFIDPQFDFELDPLTLKPNLYSGSIQCLIQLGRLESALQQIHGMVTQEPNFASSLYPYALECSWRLSRWDLLSDLLSSDKQNSFLLQNAVNRLDNMDSSASLENCHTGLLKSNWDVSQLMLVRVLQSMHQVQTSNFQKNLHDARLEIMGPLAAASVESYQRVYPFLHKLHFLHEAEQGYLAISRGKIEKADLKKIWKEQSCWEPRYQLMATSLKYRDPILALRRVMYQEANLYQEVAKNWLQYAKLARKQGYIRTATSAAMQAEALGNQYATLEKAKLLVSQSKMYDALQLLEPVARDVRDLELSSNLENARFAAKNLLLTTNWIQASGQRQGKKVIERYQAVIRYDPKWEKGYFFLAKYYEFLLTSERTSACASNTKSDERGLVLDENFHTHLINVMRNYVLSLSFGTKFLFQSLPRLLTLWFEYGELLYLAKGNSRSISMSMGSSGGMSSFREQQVLADITQVMLEATKRLPAYEWLVCFPQVASRICHPNPAVVEGVKNIMIRVLLCYPAQAMWPLLGLARSLNAQRRNRAREVISTAQRELVANHQQEISNSFTEGMRMAEELTSLAAHDSLNQRRIHVRLSRIRTKILVPIQAALTTKLPPNGLAPRDEKHEAFSSGFAGLYIKAFSDKADVMPTKEKPKRIEVLGSDGRMYAFLCKREKTGDLRKDARMMEFNTMINKLLQKDEEGRKRKLRLRTYAVVCLNEESGLMEWVRDTRAMRQLICQIHKTEKGLIQPVRITHEVKEMFLKMQKKYADNIPMMALYYRKKFLSLPMFTPRFHQWFLNNFADPSAWFESRLCFARSAAVWSMVGHIIGLGDRHGENILIDSTNGECVHVDFDCLFDKGLKLAKPEIVPFRLTPNMIDAFGITGYEGVYRRVCEVTLNLLRENKETLRSVLESFIHDPLVEWGRKGKAGGAGTNTSDLANERSKEETRIILKTIDDRLRGIYNLGDAIRPHVSSSHRSILPENETLPLSVQGQVDKLIQEAVSHENLAQMYIGWMPFL
jgi:serine/threonine-protein kinase ATR